MSFPQSLVLGSFSSQMKSYLSGCLISPRLSITVYPWPSKLHLQNSSFLSLRAKWLLSSGYFFKVSQVPQTSNFQNETIFLPNPLLFLLCPFTSVNWLVHCPSQKLGHYPWLLSLHHTQHLFSRYALWLLPFTRIHLLLFIPEILFWFMVPSSLTCIIVNPSN